MSGSTPMTEPVMDPEERRPVSVNIGRKPYQDDSEDQ